MKVFFLCRHLTFQMFYLLGKIHSPKTVCKNTTSTTGESHECFYCHEQGHLIAACPVLRKKEHKNGKPPAGVGFVTMHLHHYKLTGRYLSHRQARRLTLVLDHLFISAFVSLSVDAENTAAYHSFIVADILPP